MLIDADAAAKSLLKDFLEVEFEESIEKNYQRLFVFHIFFFMN